MHSREVFDFTPKNLRTRRIRPASHDTDPPAFPGACAAVAGTRVFSEICFKVMECAAEGLASTHSVAVSTSPADFPADRSTPVAFNEAFFDALFLAGAFFDVVFLVPAFFPAGAFFDVAFLGAAFFLTGVFLVVVFLAAVFFLAVAFPGDALLAVVFRPETFFAVAFFAVVLPAVF